MTVIFITMAIIIIYDYFNITKSELGSSAADCYDISMQTDFVVGTFSAGNCDIGSCNHDSNS